jgi:hypothetical protein
VAKANIEVALVGERDRIRLRDATLQYLAKDYWPRGDGVEV